MARRRPSSPFSSPFKLWTELTTSALRSGQQQARRQLRAVRDVTRRQLKANTARQTRQWSEATHKATEQGIAQIRQTSHQLLSGALTPVAELPRPRAGRWLEGHWGSTPLTLRRYRLFVPAGVSQRQPAPLLILLHGCAQNSAAIAVSARVAAWAQSARVVVLLPEQSAQANPQRCWNWFGAEAVVASEAATVMAIADHVAATHPVRRDAWFSFGISAGGTLALSLGLRYPSRFAAVAGHSCAVPHSASNALEAGRVMLGRLEADRAAARALLGPHRPPALFLIHGDADAVVAFDNAVASAALWLELDADRTDRPVPAAAAPRRLQRGQRRTALINDWPDPAPTTRRSRPTARVRLIRVQGLSHAWSGGAASQAFSDPRGPDALRLAWQFFTPWLPGPARRTPRRAPSA